MKRDTRHDQTSARVALVRLLTSLYILVEIYINIYLAMSWFVSSFQAVELKIRQSALTRAELLA